MFFIFRCTLSLRFKYFGGFCLRLKSILKNDRFSLKDNYFQTSEIINSKINNYLPRN